MKKIRIELLGPNSSSGSKRVEVRLLERSETSVRRDIEINLNKEVMKSLDNMEPNVVIRVLVEFSGKMLMFSCRVGGLLQKELKNIGVKWIIGKKKRDSCKYCWRPCVSICIVNSYKHCVFLHKLSVGMISNCKCMCAYTWMMHMRFDDVNWSMWSVWMCIVVSGCMRIGCLGSRNCLKVSITSSVAWLV